MDNEEKKKRPRHSGEAPPPTVVWYRELFERGHSLICIHDLDGILLAINPAAAEATGYLAEELVGKNMALLLPDETRPGFARYLERLSQNGTDTGMMKIVARDGTELVWMYRNTICDDDYGRYVLGNAQDITELRNSMRLQQHVAQDFRDLVNNSEFGIYRSTPSGRFVMVNDALVEMLGYDSQEELLNVQMSDLYYDRGRRDELMAFARTNERIRGMELEWLRKGGSRITIRTSGRVIYVSGSNEEPAFFEMFVEDVSERRAMEAQLTKIQNLEVMGQLTGGMAHDFNNILTVIITNANLIRTALKPDDEVAMTDLDELEGAARRGTAMIRRLLGFTRRVRLPTESVNVVEVIENLVRTLSRLLPETIEIGIDKLETIPTIHADPGAIEQILLNLATNSRDAMPQGGKFSFELGREHWDPRRRQEHGWGDPGDYIRVSAKDTGIGMNQETIEKIYEPLFTTKTDGKGTGLGMAMVYNLMKQHRGFVDVESVVGEGTTVHLYFPHAPEVSSAKASTQVAARVKHGSETILLVEDEESIRRAGKRILERFGYSVILAENGKEALDLFENRKNDIKLVLSDIMMPELTGIELFTKLLDLKDPPKLLLMSGYTLEDLEGTIPENFEVPFLHKPWDPSELVGAIRGVLDGEIRPSIRDSA